MEHTAYTQLLPLCLLCYIVVMCFLCADEDKHSLVETLAINLGWMSVNDGLHIIKTNHWIIRLRIILPAGGSDGFLVDI